MSENNKNVAITNSIFIAFFVQQAHQSPKILNFLSGETEMCYESAAG